MAKKKTRSQRKTSRERAYRAGDRGLPQKVDIAREPPSGYGSGSLRGELGESSRNSGTPVAVRVAIGAAIVLGLFWLVSSLRG